MPPFDSILDVRHYFLPYQIRWLADAHSIALAEKSRRIGWTYASAFRAVERRMRLGTDLFYTSVDLTAAREFMEYCIRWARFFKVMAGEIQNRDLAAFLQDAPCLADGPLRVHRVVQRLT